MTIKLNKCAYIIVTLRRFSVQDESTGSILSPSDISYDNTEDDLVNVFVNILLIIRQGLNLL